MTSKNIFFALGDHYKHLETPRRLRRLIDLGNKGLKRAFSGDSEIGKPGGPIKNEDWLYRSIIYTLFYANLHSASWILRIERKIDEVPFPYIDVELVLRAMLERLIHQHYIMTDPKRLAALFVQWRIIEHKRYYQAVEATINENPNSIAAIMEGGLKITPWSHEQEQEYNSAVKEWELLVIPKQTAEKARSWAGISLSKMAELTDLTDYYKIFYKATSWYAHSLVHVPDFYLHYDESMKAAIYHARPTKDQINQCYFETMMIYSLSLSFTGEVLRWNIEDKIDEIFDEKFSFQQYLAELAISSLQ